MTLGAPATPRRGGLVFHVGERRWFLSAEVARKVVPHPQIARIPGAPPGLLGLAWSDGAILPVIEIGPQHESLLVCLHRGEQVGLLGATRVASGVFPAGDARGVIVGAATVPELDLDEIYARMQSPTWGAGWGA